MEARHPDRLPQHNVMLAVAGVVIEDGKVLLVRDRQGFWAGVGGWIDDGEAPDEALKREFREELGVDIEIVRTLRPFIAWNVSRASRPTHFVLFFFEVRLLSHDFTLLESELTGVAWAGPSDLESYEMLPHARATITAHLPEWLAGHQD